MLKTVESQLLFHKFYNQVEVHVPQFIALTQVVLMLLHHMKVWECKLSLLFPVVLLYKGEVVHLVQGCRVEACLSDVVHTVEGGSVGSLVGKVANGRVGYSVLQILP